MKITFKKLIGICCILLFSNISFATNLRGQVVRYNNYTGQYIPLSGVRVDFWIWNGQQWVDLSYSVTGNDGFYYFTNVTPGYQFKVQVFSVFYPPNPLTVLNVNPPYYQDIAWIIT